MPTPPFSQHRRDWLEEVTGLFSKRPAKKDKTVSISPVNVRFTPKDLIDDGASTVSSAKSEAVVDGAGRPR
jgi:hypothetical protein